MNNKMINFVKDSKYKIYYNLPYTAFLLNKACTYLGVDHAKKYIRKVDGSIECVEVN